MIAARRPRLSRFRLLAPGAAAGLLVSLPALADLPVPWGLGMQPAASPVGERIVVLHDALMWIITLITLFVFALLGYTVWRFSAKKHPTPSRTSHNTPLEVLWTVIPVLILVGIAIPSFRLVFYQDRAQNADMTIKVTARQWYWHYIYADADDLNFDSRMVPDDELKPGQHRLLEVDNELVVPAGKTIRVLTTSDDVIHSWFIPSLGVQRYAIQGRAIETWFRADRPGTYHGQCNQICGMMHAYMPIVVRAVPEAEFTAWLAEAKKKFAANGGNPITIAAAAATTPAAQPIRD
ncbi:MAG: cytochrome c oxidase subunit II [Acetobacteraceae bacterium]|nr:cytochrome c oxidase subunit II [Acetobacteraceae bacterium]